jgi:hypothetical protein
MIPKIGPAIVGGPFSFGSRALTSGAGGPMPRVSFHSLLQWHPADPRSAPLGRTSEQPLSAGERPRLLTRSAIDDSPDPQHRRRAAFAPPEGCSIPAAAIVASLPPGPAGSASTPSAAVASLEELIPAMVRRISWAGDRHRGSLRLELGAGELAGTTLTVHADGGIVRVNMLTPPGVDTALWQRRISGRLAARGIPTESVEVT